MKSRTIALILIGVCAAVACTRAAAQYGATDGEWRHYAADAGSTKYSNLDQIDASNFKDLEVAWRWQSVDSELEEVTSFKPFYFRGTPIMVKGVLYLSTGLSQIAAIDATSGETLWVHDPKSYERGPVTHSMFHHRGVTYWTDGARERIFMSTGGRQLVSVDTRTGQPDPEFADGSWVDLLEGLGRKVNARDIGDNKPVLAVGDTVVVGSIIMDFPMRKLNPPGHIRGYDAKTGAMKWIFHTIPQEGEVGVETWENDSWKVSGNTNAWSLMTADPETGLLYLPIGTPTSDYYGGHRHGDNLFAESLLCLDSKTGERKWHFQAVHHGIWDYDFPCAPNLIDITVNGGKIKAVAQVSKQGFTYVFDRVTGVPIWPIEERPVDTNTTVPGEKMAPTQPFPTKPPAFERQGITEDDLIDFTPELRAEALEIVKDFVMGPLFTPNIVKDSNGKKAMLQLPSAGGGANWPGASVDPETGYLYVQSQTFPSAMSLTKTNPAMSDLDYTINFGGMEGSGGPRGLPLTKPPYRRITAIDLNRGDIAWQVPFGDGPRNHPAIKHLNLPPLGSFFPDGVIAEGGICVTKTLLFTILADTSDRDNGGTAQSEIVELDANGDVALPTAKAGISSWLLALDKATGKEVGRIKIDRHLHGSPMTYMKNGVQYVAVTGGGVTEPSELIAFALPAA